MTSNTYVYALTHLVLWLGLQFRPNFGRTSQVCANILFKPFVTDNVDPKVDRNFIMLFTRFFFFVLQSGRCDGYILEGKELEFYQKMLAKKKSK